MPHEPRKFLHDLLDSARLYAYSLKGRNKSAQGSALGGGSKRFTLALKGRKKDARLFYPFRATATVVVPFVPRALPWAGMLEPFRLQSLEGS